MNDTNPIKQNFVFVNLIIQNFVFVNIPKISSAPVGSSSVLQQYITDPVLGQKSLKKN